MKNSRVVELGVVVIGYILVFLLLIGPAIGAVSGFNQPAIGLTNDIGGEIPTGVRGGILVLTSSLVMVGYMVLRAKVAGVSPDVYWGR